MPEKEGKKQYQPDQGKLNWFLGFLEGRARIQPPDWWIKVLLNARANCRHHFYFDLPENNHYDFPRKTLYHDAGLNNFVAPLDTTLHKEGDKSVLQVGKESVALPGAVFDNDMNNAVSALVTPGRCYVAAHWSIGGYSLFCLERSSSKVLWKTTVLGGFTGGLGGFAEQWVTITKQGDRIVVFGCALDIYVEGFRADNGVNLFRFSDFASGE